MKTQAITMLLALTGVASAGEMKLLNDHLRITLPDGADYFTPAVGLMEADHNSGETSIMVGKDDSSICVQVEEKQCLADDKFAEGVKKAMSNLNREDNYFIIDQMGDNLVYALFRKGSDKVLPGRHAPYAYAEYRHPDGTVQKFTILVAKDAAKDVEKTHAMVKGWLKSVKPGATPLNLKERVEHQVSYMKELTRLAVPVPEGYTSTLNDGEGFHFATYTKLGKPGEAREELSVQVGDHPEIWFREIPSSKQKTQSGTLLGQKVEWHLFGEADEAKVAECVLPLGMRGGKVDFSEKGDGEIIYVRATVIGKDAATRTKLIQQAEKITLQTEPKP